MKVLWIDDEYDTLELINESAAENDIELIGFKSAEEALRELERPEKYDAVVLDGLFYLNISDQGIPSNDTPFGKVARKLFALKEKGNILPWFILSGKTSFTLDQNSMVEALADQDFAEGKVYDKKKKEENLLWPELKKAVAAIPDYALKQKYNRVFAVCTDKYLGSETSLSFLYLLKTVEGESDDQNTEDRLNAIRKIIEKLFVSFNKIGVLPNEVLKGHAHITNSSKFLAGSHNSYVLSKSILHPTAAYILRSILSITQDGSHSEGDLNLRVDEFIKKQSSPYLFRSTIFQLLDLLIWFKAFVDENPDIERNKTLSSLKQTDTGLNYIDEIQQDGMNNYHCGQYLLNYTYVAENFKVGQTIQITEFSVNNNPRTKELYPKFASKFKPL